MTSGNDKRLRRNTRLSRLTGHILGPVLRKQGKAFEEVAKNWRYISGMAAEWSLPLAVTFPDTEDDRAVLTIAVSSARAPEIQMLTLISLNEQMPVLDIRLLAAFALINPAHKSLNPLPQHSKSRRRHGTYQQMIKPP